MRNVWKGLVVGGLTGVTAGIVLDAAARASKKASAMGEHVRDHAPEAGRWIQTVAGKAGEKIHDVDVPEHVRDAAQRVRESDAAQRVAQRGDDVVSAAKDAVASHSG